MDYWKKSIKFNSTIILHIVHDKIDKTSTHTYLPVR